MDKDDSDSSKSDDDDNDDMPDNYNYSRRRSRAVLYHISGQLNKQNKAKTKLQQLNRVSIFVVREAIRSSSVNKQDHSAAIQLGKFSRGPRSRKEQLQKRNKTK